MYGLPLSQSDQRIRQENFPMIAAVRRGRSGLTSVSDFLTSVAFTTCCLTFDLTSVDIIKRIEVRTSKKF